MPLLVPKKGTNCGKLKKLKVPVLLPKVGKKLILVLMARKRVLVLQ